MSEYMEKYSVSKLIGSQHEIDLFAFLRIHGLEDRDVSIRGSDALLGEDIADVHAHAGKKISCGDTGLVAEALQTGISHECGISKVRIIDGSGLFLDDLLVCVVDAGLYIAGSRRGSFGVRCIAGIQSQTGYGILGGILNNVCLWFCAFLSLGRFRLDAGEQLIQLL